MDGRKNLLHFIHSYQEASRVVCGSFANLYHLLPHCM